ncbi:MAG: FHA domain-containing protein [Armatimonadota bacterium]
MKSTAPLVIALAALSPAASWAQSAAPSPKPAASTIAAPGPAAVTKGKPAIPSDTKATAETAAPTAVATPATKAVDASPTASATAGATAAPAASPPAVVVVTQPAAPVVAPPPANNWGAGLLGLLILGFGGYYGLRYAQKRGVTVADSLQKLGVEMPQDGVNGPATISHLKPPPPQAAPLPPLPSLANLPEAASLGSGAAAAVAPSPAKRTGSGNLVGTLGPVEGKQLTVHTGGPLTMGRDMDNTLPLPDDTTVSRRHARIEATADGNGFQIVDEGSSNGTFVNGHRLTAGQIRALVVGDEIQIGASRLRFEG